MSNTITFNGKSIAIDNFEAQQNANSKILFYVVRTADSDSSAIFAALNGSPQTISLSSGKGAPAFTITNGVISNYQYATEGESSTKEFFHVTGSAVTMAIKTS